MPLRNKLIIPIVVEKSDEIEERCADYQGEIIKTICKILQIEHNHNVSRTRSIQKDIDDALIENAQFLSRKREQGAENERIEP